MVGHSRARVAVAALAGMPAKRLLVMEVLVAPAADEGGDGCVSGNVRDVVEDAGHVGVDGRGGMLVVRAAAARAVRALHLGLSLPTAVAGLLLVFIIPALALARAFGREKGVLLAEEGVTG